MINKVRIKRLLKHSFNNNNDNNNNMTKELERLEGGPKAKIHIDLLKTKLKNIKLENVRP